MIEKQIDSDQKKHQQPISAVRQSPAAGTNGTAIIPPSYGVDFVDHGLGSTDLVIQTKLIINQPGDIYEREADEVANQIMRMSEPSLQGKSMHPAGSGIVSPKLEAGSASLGQPLDQATRSFMEPRFGADFSQVRIHTDSLAGQLSRQLKAQAFTHQEHIYYAPGKTPGINPLTAHELTHVVQQSRGGTSVGNNPLGVHGQPHAPAIQRALEVRPPGRGEASAFDRRQELIDRLNAQSAAIQYRLEGRRILYTVIDGTALTSFDRQMQRFIDRAELVPMRLITSAGLVMGATGNYETLMADSLVAGYVDLDDLMADDDYSFRSDLVHFLTERFSIRNYERRIGAELPPTAITKAEFDRGHRLGKEAEVELLREFFNDPSIVFNYDDMLPSGSWLNNFRSRTHGYQVFQVVRGANRARAGGEMFVRTRDGRRVTMDAFRAERTAAPAAP